MKKVKNYVACAMAALMMAGAAPVAAVSAYADTTTEVTADAAQTLNLDYVGADYVDISWAANSQDHAIDGTGNGVLYMAVTYKDDTREVVSQKQASFTGATVTGLEPGTAYTTTIIRVVVAGRAGSSSQNLGSLSYVTKAE